MKISKTEVKHIANLARIELTEAEIIQYGTELSAILDYIDELKQLDITNAKEIGQITGLTNQLAEDKIENCAISQKELLADAPAIENSQVKVKSVLGRET